MTDSAKRMSKHLWSGLISDDPAADVGVLGVPFDGAVSFRTGAALAPARLRELSPHLAACAEEGQPLTVQVRDYGDVRLDPEGPAYFQAVEEQAKQPLQHPLALFLGGDHSVTIPLMRAFDGEADGSFGVLHLDAHPDLFDTYGGHRWSHACTARRALELPGLEPRHLVFIGLCSFARTEWDFFQKHPEIHYHTARQCYKQTIEAVAEQVVERLHDVQSLYVTLDIDVLDGAYGPGTGYPEGVGLSTREVLELLRTVFQELPVRAMDLVEVAPPLDQSDVTSFAALKLIYEAWFAIQQTTS